MVFWVSFLMPETRGKNLPLWFSIVPPQGGVMIE